MKGGLYQIYAGVAEDEEMEIGENTVIDEPEVDEEVPESPKTGDGGATGYALLIGMMALMGMAIVTRKE